MSRPIWISVDDGDTFEGHQLHWADCYFSNAYEDVIRDYCEDDGSTVEIREMTDEEVAQYPDLLSFVESLNNK